jgi:hypothetical protein
MNCRRWCVGVTVVVAAVGIGGIPAAAQQSPPAVKLPAVTVPPIDVPVPSGGPQIATPPISTPEISTPAVQTPAIQTPVGTVPSVSVPAVKVEPVTVSPVPTVPAGGDSGGKPAAGGAGAGKPIAGDAPPTRSDPPSAGASTDPPARPVAPAIAVRDTTAQHTARPRASSPHVPAARRGHRAAHATPRRRTPEQPDTRRPVVREAAPRVVADRHTPAAVPIAVAADRHETDERPFIDSLGNALRLAPILMALALAGALCVASRLRRT